MNKELELIIKAIEDKKGRDILVLDFENRSSLYQNVVIASGSSSRNVKAIAEEIEEVLEKEGFQRIGMEGKSEATWVLLDYGDVVVHILNDREREYYRLEELWSKETVLYRG